MKGLIFAHVQMSLPLSITIIGAGAWSTAMALHLARLDHKVILLPRRKEQAEKLLAEDENKDYLPGYPFNGRLEIACSDREAIEGADVVFMGAPSYAVREWGMRIRDIVTDMVSPPLFVSLAKGLELSSGKTPCELMEETLPGCPVGCLSGPTFASEVAAGRPTAMTLAVQGNDELASKLQEAASGPNLRLYLSKDLKGVEMGGCLKNVYAISAGCCQGLGLGDNALAALLTRAMAEMPRVGIELGAEKETFLGLSGFGDLMATCHGDWSRNRTFGEEVARGGKASDIISAQKTAVEGYRTAKAFYDQCVEKEIDAPILGEVYRILYEDKPPSRALEDLMNRDLRHE
ncbi:NAD(P)H-dependent glycerol-3-phosphate dehydrogenase [Puniceicoccaceae bacterium K14]|nr:NAD(P)H-dependent glycerol-3-phosphate dehydrogenase [Puniceicoccaceae bacterium K14]